MLYYYLSMKRIFSLLVSMSLLVSCGGDEEEPLIKPIPTPDPDPVVPVDPDIPQSGYTELYRPQVHYTPAKNWVNDPNGMVYINGTWHLFYQYNPYGNDWGNMSWGHATTTDLMHWKEQPVALVRDELGDIFSGSCVVDKNNTAGFGADAVVAFFTSAAEHQQQSMAYSTDGLKTLIKYTGNPIIPNNDRPDFRDPKVFWHEASQQWVMALALGWKCEVELWTSPDLRTWKYASTFKTDVARCHNCQWECPDLIELPYEGGTKWVLILNVNPGGPTAGSGIQCFIGSFDGKEFKADDLDYPMWMDTGMDNYAGVTWSNAPENRKVLIGWMNNWKYCGGVPCNPWRSAFTLPRELSLVNVGGKPYIASKVVKEIDAIAGDWKELSSGASMGNPDAYHAQVTIPTDQVISFSLSNAKNERLEFETDPIYHQLKARRTSVTGANPNDFSIPAVKGNFVGDAKTVTLDIYVDQSSVEVISADGTFVMTNLVFPSTIYNQINVPASASGLKYRELKSVWK